ncbi:GNAT family N-acetyltransferase [Sphaerisporangium sp. NBC_01403]|uniref:GNAT family N-acetyltransferase n=1 Tax=Sphaerisporangium sp. NBC_01403 TaxID=2903599 RepID=UPI00324DA95A
MSDDLRLRAVDEADLEVFLEQEHDPEAVRRSKFPPREREAFMTHWTTRILGDPTVLVRAVIVDGELAGNIVSWWEQERRFIGYWYGRAFWGRGIGSTAMMLFLQEEKTRPLYADPYVGNTGSVRLLEKCGFQRTGTVQHGDDEHVMLVLSES